MCIDIEERAVGLCLDDGREVVFGRHSKEPTNPYVAQFSYNTGDKSGRISLFVNNPEYIRLMDGWIDGVIDGVIEGVIEGLIKGLIKGRTDIDDPEKILINCYQEKVLPQLLLQNKESCHSNVALQVIKRDMDSLRDPLNIQGRDWRTVDALKEFIFRASLRRGYNSRGINLEGLYGKVVEQGSTEILRRFLR